MRIYLGYGWAQTSVVNDLLTNPRRPNATALGFVGMGTGTVLLLNLLRFRLAWWPLHPVGYALAMNFGVDYCWFSLLVAMTLKTAAIRVGGLRMARRLQAAMTGIMVAEYATETLWSAVAMIGRVPTYSTSINGRLGWMQ